LQRATKILVGGTALAFGLGAGTYLAVEYAKGGIGSRFVASPSLAVSPPEPFPPGQQNIIATVSWTNPTGSAVAYAVQGTIFENVAQGLIVGGHFFASALLAQQAEAAFNAGGQAAASQYSQTPGDRLATTTVAAGAQGSVNLYAIDTVEPGQVWTFLIAPNPSGALLAPDPVGTAIAKLPQPSLLVTVEAS
jgi:hypothetical protein